MTSETTTNLPKTKEVIINLSKSVEEVLTLVAILSAVFESVPFSDGEAQLVYHLSGEMSDEEIEEKIEPCIGAHVAHTIINNL
jgi:hypothetical protein